MRVWIAVFLLLLFATQAFPVALLGKSYEKAKVSLIDDSGEDEEGSAIPKEGKAKKQNSLSEEDYDHSHDHVGLDYSGLEARRRMLHQQANLYALYTGEVTTPPPNFC